MTRKQRRLILIGSALGVLAIAVALMLNAFRDSIVFFNSPSDVAEKHIAPGTLIRLGGLVKAGSLARGDDLKIRFDVTDGPTARSRSPIRVCCPICFGKGRASSPKARWTVPACSQPTRSSPNTTRRAEGGRRRVEKVGALREAMGAGGGGK